MTSDRFQKALQAIRELDAEERKTLLQMLTAGGIWQDSGAAAGQPGVNDGNADSEPSSTTQ
ncbi:MAG: hypothetical protein M3Z37_01780 [Candidatus Eremiobacteraeota bacterium]|nr:hypothetical protein [Candidatus Eremiobacteraeota bacterium]